MSVYTPVSRAQLEAFLKNYPLGALIDHKGISAGIVNTNYFVTTERGQYVLTLFETLKFDELGYFLDLMAYLAEHDVPTAHPVADHDGHYLRQLNGKPAALVARLPGGGVEQPSLAQCAAIGGCMAKFHGAGQDFPGSRENDRGPHWWAVTAKGVRPHLSSEDAALLQAELEFQAGHRHAHLPRGVIHADLFRDNALFNGDTLTGVIDLYYACNDVLLYDLAVTVNDWCCDAEGDLDALKTQTLLQAYQQARPMGEAERQAWSVMLRAAALRFWLSRLQDQIFPRDGELTHIKDPNVFKRILQKRIANTGREIWLS